MERTTVSLSNVQAVFPEGLRSESEGSKVTMSAYQRETDLLKHTIGFEDCLECLKLVERIAQLERDQLCVQRAASLMASLTVLTAVGFGYGLALQENFPHGAFSFAAWLMAALGLASLISLLAFAGLWLFVRTKSNDLLRECRRLVTKLLQTPQAPREPLRSHPVSRNPAPCPTGPLRARRNIGRNKIKSINEIVADEISPRLLQSMR